MNAEASETSPVLLHSYVGNRSTAWGHFAAGAIIVSTPMMILFFFLDKHLLDSLTAGTVKG